MTTTLTGTLITEKDERIVRLILTVRAHAASTLRMHAVRLLYTESLLAGAGKYTRESWQDTLSTLGANITVSLDSGDIDFSVRALDTVLPKVLILFSTLFADPLFSPKELDRIKTYVTHNLERLKDDARLHSYQNFMSRVCAIGDRRSVYGIDDVIKEIQKVSIKDIKGFHDSLWDYEWFYTAGGSPKSTEQCVKTLTKIQKIRKGKEVKAYAPMSIQKVSGRQVLLHSVPHKQNIEFSIGSSLPILRTDPRYAALMFGISVLGLPGGFTGRLMSIVREKEGLTYGIYGRVEEVTAHEDGVWRISTFFSPKDAVKGISSVLREVARIRDEGITDDELMRFKVILSTRFALIGDSLLKRVSESHGLMKIGIEDETYTTFKKKIQSLTLSEVNDALKEYLDTTNIIISGAGPVDGVKKELMKFSH